MSEHNDDTITLADAVAAWVQSDADDERRHTDLVDLLNYCADATVQVLADGDAETAEALAQLMIPLRAELRRWPYAAALPPYSSFLGCLQALLRAEEAQLTRLFAALDEGLAAAVEQIGDLVAQQRAAATDSEAAAPDEPPAADAGGIPPELERALQSGDAAEVQRVLETLSPAERTAAFAALRRRSEQRVAAMKPEEQRSLALHLRHEQIARIAADAAGLAEQALREDDPDARRRLAIEMGQLATHYAQGEERGSPYDDLASFLRGIAAVLRGTPVPPAPPAFAERLAALRALADQAD